MHIYENNAELLQNSSPFEYYSAVRNQLSVASTIGMESFAERVHFASLALFLPQGFYEHPEFKNFLHRVSRGAIYALEIEMLTDSFWNR